MAKLVRAVGTKNLQADILLFNLQMVGLTITLPAVGVLLPRSYASVIARP